MRPVFRITTLLAAIALLGACDQQASAPAAGAEQAAAVKPAAAQQPFLRNGELLSVHVDNMPRAAILAKLGELTGSKITAEGDNNVVLTVHVDDASLRQVLAQVLVDAPYSATMQYANLQDSFPASVTVTHYRGGAVAAPTAAVPTPGLIAGLPAGVQPPVAPVEVAEPEGPDFASLPPEERLSHFIAQTEDDQVALIFDMEPTPEDAKLMTALIQKEEISSDVKIEMLDSLSNGEYEDSAPAVKLALQSQDPEVATRAIEVLVELGDEKDVPALQKLAEESTDEAVKQAAQDGIETLTP